MWPALAAVQLVHGLSEARQGLAEVQQAKAQLSASDLVAQAPAVPLAAANRSFSSAHGALTSPALAPFEIVPVLGRQLQAVQDLSGAAGQATGVAVGSVDALKLVLDTPHTAGPDRITVLRRLSALAATTNQGLERIDPSPWKGAPRPGGVEIQRVRGGSRPGEDHSLERGPRPRRRLPAFCRVLSSTWS